jgi:predicted ArsR family transcriptional regulator
MADIPVPRYQAFWTDTYNKLKSEYQQLIGQVPDADAQLKQLLKVIRDIEEMARYTPASVGKSEL